MKKIQFTQNYGDHANGTVIGTTDSAAQKLVSQGKAKYVADDVRALKYAPDAPVQAECIAPVFEELEAAPKGATFPKHIIEEVEAQLTANKK